MIDMDKILENVSEPALWCGMDIEATDLARVASIAIENKVSPISVGPNSVSILWPWLEGKNIKIYSRFYFDGKENQASIISEKINFTFKHGADGAQVFVSRRNLNDFVSQLYLIRDDLFFNKDIFIGLNINEIDAFEWNEIFSSLEKMRATGLILVLAKDDGDKSDFVGRVYSALSALNNKNIKLHFVLGIKPYRVEQVVRLVKSMATEIEHNLKFFINA